MLSSLNTSQTISADVPVSLPLGPISSVSHPPLSVYLCLFTSSFSVAVSAKSLLVSRPLPSCLSLRFISRRLSDACGQYLPLCGVFYPLALSSILRVLVSFSPRISFLLNMLAFRSLTSPTVSSLPPMSSCFPFPSLQNNMIFSQSCRSQFCRNALHPGTVLNWGDEHVNVVKSHRRTHRHSLNTHNAW